MACNVELQIDFSRDTECYCEVAVSEKQEVSIGVSNISSYN